MKIISFSQQGPKAICVLSANGIISNVTLRQPDSLGGTLTYEVSTKFSFQYVDSPTFLPKFSPRLCLKHERQNGSPVDY
jgi:hypothetical protein